MTASKRLLERASWPNGMGVTFFPRGERETWFVEKCFSKSNPTRMVTKRWDGAFLFLVETARFAPANKLVESISGVGYSIRTYHDVGARLMVAVGYVMGREFARSTYLPEGACGIRIDATDRIRILCVGELARLASALPALHPNDVAELSLGSVVKS